MSDNLQSFPAYKESDTPWLEKIPTHWEITSFGSLFTVRSERNRPDLPLLSVVRERGVLLRSSMQADENHNYIPDDLSNYKVVHRGDLVINKMKAWQGSVGVSEYDGVVSPAYFVFRHEIKNWQYLHKLLRSRSYVAFFAQASDGVRIGQWDLSTSGMKRIPILIPPPEEQTAIVRYLDHVDRRIRRYIRTKQTLIKLLNEQKQIIIQQAVTGGLNPDAPRKDSGVEWLGAVPAHWEEHPAKHFFREIDERSETGAEELLSVSHITGVTPRSQKNITMFMASSYVGHKLCNSGDLVINTMWAWMGALGVAKQRGIISSSYAVYRPVKIDKFVPAFADHLLRVKPYISEYICRSSGIRSSRLRLYPEKFLTIPILCPPYEEQQQIVAFIEQEIKQFQVVIERTEREIDLMREYRTRLIADIVTGKLDVRAIATQLPDEIDNLDVVDEIDDRIEEDDDLSELIEETSEE